MTKELNRSALVLTDPQFMLDPQYGDVGAGEAIKEWSLVGQNWKYCGGFFWEQAAS